MINVEKDDVIGGKDLELYMVLEDDPTVTPDDADWLRLPGVESWDPTYNPNDQPVNSAGSRRMVARTGGGPYDIGASATIKALNDNWLELLKLALGSAAGTTEVKKPTASLLAEIRRDIGGANEYFLANLFNGFKLGTASFEKSVSAVPFRTIFSGRAPFMQPSQTLNPPSDPVGKARFIGHQGTVIDPLDVGTYEAKPPKDRRPVMYYDFEEQLQYNGGALEPMLNIGGWQLQLTDTLIPIPGKVTGADGVRRPLWKAMAEEGQIVMLKLQTVPQMLDYYLDMIELKWIDELRITYTPPPGYTSGPKTIKLLGGRWEPGDLSIKELVTVNHEIPATFIDVEVV